MIEERYSPFQKRGREEEEEREGRGEGGEREEEEEREEEHLRSLQTQLRPDARELFSLIVHCHNTIMSTVVCNLFDSRLCIVRHTQCKAR